MLGVVKEFPKEDSSIYSVQEGVFFPRPFNAAELMGHVANVKAVIV